MGIARSTYYYKSKKNPPAIELAERIENIALDFPSYGYRRITAELHWAKYKPKRVLRLMRTGPERHLKLPQVHLTALQSILCCHKG